MVAVIYLKLNRLPVLNAFFETGFGSKYASEICSKLKERKIGSATRYFAAELNLMQ